MDPKTIAEINELKGASKHAYFYLEPGLKMALELLGQECKILENAIALLSSADDDQGDLKTLEMELRAYRMSQGFLREQMEKLGQCKLNREDFCWGC